MCLGVHEAKVRCVCRRFACT